MKLDPRDTPVSCTDVPALALYEQALREYQSYIGDAVATIDRALAAQPDFVLGHAFRAGVLMTFSEQRFVRPAADSVEAGERLRGQANDRERTLLAAARKLVERDWAGACALYERVLVEHPRDAFALQTGHLFDFYRGDTLNLRNRVARVLPHWSDTVPGASYVHGMHAFGLEECNQYAEAEQAARRALAMEPRDAWAVHAGVHCMEMQGRVDQGIGWLRERENDWVPDCAFAFHNWWHLALLELDRGNAAEVLALYDQFIFGQPSDVALQLVDATALLWRLRLLGVDSGERFAVLARIWASKLEEEQGFYSFNDLHAVLAFVGAGMQVEAERMLASTANSIGAEVGVPVARAVLALESGHAATAVELLIGVRDQSYRFGGSHAQRDLITLTLIEAARQAGNPGLARHYLAERRMQRPHSALAGRLEARL